MAKQHGSINSAGRVKKFIEKLKVAKAEKPVAPLRGRAAKRLQYKRRILAQPPVPGKRYPGPNNVCSIFLAFLP